MGAFNSDGPAVFCGELFCFMCREKYSESMLESAGKRLGNQFFCPSCGRWIGAVESSFATISITPFRLLLSKLPPGFYLALHDDNVRSVQEIVDHATVTLVYRDLAAIGTFPITVDPDEIVKAAEEYLKNTSPPEDERTV